MNGRRFFVALTVVVALATAACGSSSKTVAPPPAGSSTTTTVHVVSKAPGTGVTATSIKLGISLVDFKCIEQFVDSVRLTQQEVYQAYVSDINDKGGINGRKIVPVFKTYCPLTSTGDLNVQICTAFADDDKVFAVMGNLTDAAQDGSVETCLAKKHKTPVITYVLTQTIMNLSPPGMVIFPGTTPERSSAALIELLKAKGTLNGKKVAVLAQSTVEPSVKSVVLPGLKKIGVATGTPAYLTVNGADTTAAQAQLSSFIERWKSENVNALYVTGENVATQQFIEKVVAQMPGVLLMTDVGDTKTFGQDETKAQKNPNPYEGLLYAGGYSPHDYTLSENWKYCKAIYEKYTHKIAPDAETKVPGPNGKQLDTYGSINDACQSLSLFHDIVAKIGQYVNADNWVATVNSFGPVTNRGGGPYASLTAGKYDMDDTFQLQSFDSSLPPLGNWKSLGPYQNIAK
jgi:ABC-type branched-subunit amino acid transport system substrate-binding protein